MVTKVLVLLAVLLMPITTWAQSTDNHIEGSSIERYSQVV
jgi:hypothetical protein